ncbi:MAG: hypothetical protein K8L97_27685 [Anaerolineae bacterium]|nr:hypothetical protein [Anaerolineae bacterium]
MFIFGLLAAVLGIIGIIRPEFILSVLGFQVIDRTARAAGDYTLVFATASSMASLNMGIYYVLASLTNWKPFYRWTVPFRIVTFTVFTLAVVNGIAPTAFIGVGLWELIGALATGAALFYERGRDQNRT